ncbi:CHC2 zinc finger domain-containing protein [Rhodocyclus purpureus]|uniref:CHC2 zinc finger domain-containing protein n=1 Tax=Rhodocyclus purpureus TaxID=1067 RepID=UPI001911F15D|nr:CHC2 zinc finger domain-containing protein [Rhodocyclus purpureus]MBK5915135.1 hypothetical protein [Rhodocyclus purpureus]
MHRIDQSDIDALLARVDIVSVIDQFVPLKKAGSEFEALCPFHSEKTPSFRVVPAKGFYHCHGCGTHGNAIDFMMEYGSMGFREAFQALGGVIPGEENAPALPVRPAPAPRADVQADDESPWVAVLPAPADAPEPPRAHYVRGLPECVWAYRNFTGSLLGFVYRFRRSGGGKETLPLVWCRNELTGACEWRWKAFPEPRPLYGLDRLAARPSAPVLVVEGEKCADAGHLALPDFVTVSWPGGGKAVSKASWEALRDREVWLWPDCDAARVPLTQDQLLELVGDPELSALPRSRERTARLQAAVKLHQEAVDAAAARQPLLPVEEQPGVRAMNEVAEILRGLGCTVRLVPIPDPGEAPSGWDIADAIEDGLLGEALAVRVRSAPLLFSSDLAAADACDADDASPLPWEEGAPADSPVPSGGEASPAAPAHSGGAGAEAAGSTSQPGAAKPKKEKKPVDWNKFNDLAENFVLVYGTDTVWDCLQKMLIKVNHLRLAFGSDLVKMWLGSEKRRMVRLDQLVFEPGREVEYPAINLFDGFEMKPKRGDCDPLIELLAYLCRDSAETPEDVERVVDWVLKWLALPLQRPGAKMRSALVFHGPQGAGKNLFFESVAAIYGKYSIVVGQGQLESQYNEWCSRRLMAIGDEVIARAELYHHKNKLKSLITGETIPIEQKFMPMRVESNHLNVVFLSNETQPLALEEGDRRYFVVYTPSQNQEGLYERVDQCLRAGGAEALYRYLLDYPLGDFSEFTRPLMTTAKRDLIELGLRPAERFIREWLAGYLPLPLQVCSATQLYRAFRRWCGATGERFPPPQEQFTKVVQKYVSQLSEKAGKPLLIRYKVVKLSDPVRGKRCDRMWIPSGCGAPEGMTEGAWAADSSVAFEKPLHDFLSEGVPAGTVGQ